MTEAMNTGAMNKEEETFEQKLARTQGVDQDFAGVLVDNWQRVLGGFLAVLLGVWVYGEYKSANESKVGEASKRFAQVQETLTKLRTEQENKDQLAKLITDNITALKTTFDGTSYSVLAPLYEATSLYTQGKLAEAEQKYSTLSQVPYEKEFGRNDLIKELAGLGLARVQLDQQKDADAFITLEGLIKNSKVVNLEALLVFARVSEDRSKVETLAKELKQTRPEFGEQLDREIVKYGFNLAN